MWVILAYLAICVILAYLAYLWVTLTWLLSRSSVSSFLHWRWSAKVSSEVERDLELHRRQCIKLLSTSSAHSSAAKLTNIENAIYQSQGNGLYRIVTSEQRNLKLITKSKTNSTKASEQWLKLLLYTNYNSIFEKELESLFFCSDTILLPIRSLTTY